MERANVHLGAELKRRLEEAAARSGVPEGRLIREALARYLDGREAPALRPVGRSGDGGVADRDQEALRDLGFARG